ncbi:MAG: glycosyltransferase family 25 protein [Burkholderiaceae bacterium]|nr:glycosyltransferase family 25 protein [Burkholderiaceae bacterium]MDZ4145518.1 glycosyltransferase family 25 protein [Burkholderiales bacterium]
MHNDHLRIFVINLAASRDRLEKISHALGSRGIRFERVDAVDGRQLPQPRRWLSPISLILVGRRLLPSEIGCWLSHRKIWQRMVDEDIPLALVLEDDAVPRVTLDDLLAVDPARAKLDLLRVHVLKAQRLEANCHRTRIFQADREIVMQTYPSHSATAYFLTLAGARKLLSMQRILAPLDWFSLWSLVVGLKHGILAPNMFDAKIDDTSTIGKRDSNAWQRLYKHMLRHLILRHVDRWMLRRFMKET